MLVITNKKKEYLAGLNKVYCYVLHNHLNQHTTRYPDYNYEI